MADNLIQIKAFLGKYYPELNYSAIQDKYKNTKLDTLFEQRFIIQNNKAQMVVDASMAGLTAIVIGNEVYVSKELYDHPNITVSNSMEQPDHNINPRSLYNPDTFSTVAYLICQNQTTFHITGEIDEPIYLKYKSEYETFYSSVITIEVDNGVEVEVVEEIESFSALNSVINYILHPGSKLDLRTFYQNHVSALSYFFRNIFALDDTSYSHILFGKGSSNIIDENKLTTHKNSKAEFFGIINSTGRNFHSILAVQPTTEAYSVNVDYRDILSGKADVTFFPVIFGQVPIDSATISVSNIVLEDIPDDRIEDEIKEYISDIVDRSTLGRMVGVKRFYDNKSKFLHFQ